MNLFSQLSQEMAVAKTSETVKVKSDFRHTVNYLKKLGVPANNHIQVGSVKPTVPTKIKDKFSSLNPLQPLCVQLELGSSEEKALTLQTRCGDQQAGLTLHVKSFPLNKEIRGTMWHSWPWLHDIELPPVIEVLLCTDRTFHNPFRTIVWSFLCCWWVKLSCFSSLKGPLLHPGNLGPASFQDSAQCGRTEAAHIWLEYECCWWTSGCTPLLLSSRAQPDQETTQAGHGPDRSVQRSVSIQNRVSFLFSVWSHH